MATRVTEEGLLIPKEVRPGPLDAALGHKAHQLARNDDPVGLRRRLGRGLGGADAEPQGHGASVLERTRLSNPTAPGGRSSRTPVTPATETQ